MMYPDLDTYKSSYFSISLSFIQLTSCQSVPRMFNIRRGDGLQDVSRLHPCTREQKVSSSTPIPVQDPGL